MPFNLKLFVIAVLCGSALVAAVSNSVSMALRLVGGEALGSVRPVALMGWGVTLYLHRRMGWPPFRQSGRS